MKKQVKKVKGFHQIIYNRKKSNRKLYQNNTFKKILLNKQI